jgi:hypothetical protein
MEMFEPTLFTWILTGFGIITCMPLLIAQLVILVQPKGQKAKDILIALSVYINIILWFQEKEYVYPSRGPLQYYTYYWGNFIYWGVAALLYGIYRIV